MQLRKKYAFCWAGWVAAFSLSAQGADLPVVGGPPARSRVVMVENSHATVAFQPATPVVQSMVDRGILKLTGKPDLKQAWRTYVNPKDIVGIKVYSGPGANSGTRPAVVGAVIEGLLKAGLSPSHIIIWDKSLVDLRLAGFDELAHLYKVRLAGSADAGYDESVSYSSPVMGNLMAGDYEFDHGGKTSGRNSYVSKLVTKTITKIINISPLLNHNYAGVCGNMYSLALGSVDNTLRFKDNPDRLATVVPEIYAKPALGDHVVLNITDALIGQYLGEQLSMLHYSTELNQIWFSTDPVALDVLSIQELARERQEKKMQAVYSNPDLYKNASFFLELGEGDPAKIRVEMVK